MVFSSSIFLFYFLPAVLGLYYLAPRRVKHLVLTLCSYFFYGWTNPLFVFLMLASTLVDYICGLVISGAHPWRGPEPQTLEPGTRTRRQRIAMWVSICTNLSLLGFFKYFNFGVDAYNDLMIALGWHSAAWDHFWRITLPLGISFYTFQSMSYAIDVYRGEAKAVRNLTDFACYVAMFPQLVAGPIIRYREVANQLAERAHTMEKFARGVAFFALGLAKKILLANPCGQLADAAFDAGSVSMVDAWFGAFGYAFQIYFDFSGYSDMAIGLGLMLGFVFPKNFDQPYLSRSITELWQRWHLSLSHFLRDYLYISLGGNRKGKVRTYANLAVVMLLGGLWHGASWNFVIWGGIHGGMLAFERSMGKDSLYRNLPDPVKMLLTFLITTLAWVFFRAADLPSAVTYLAAMFGMTQTQPGADLLAGFLYQPYFLICMAVSAYVVWACRDTWDFTRRITPATAAWSFFLLVLSLVVMVTQSYNPFIYFIF
ncbi:MAG: MBOAT family protein [Acidobacteriota bacterium]|nr:MBOAT family protein [Acidobacteriota bacterium]